MLNKEITLYLIMILRTFPLSWLYELYNDDPLKQKTVYNFVKYLEDAKYISIHKTFSGTKFLTLTPKGYEKANQSNISSYKYVSWSKASDRAGTMGENHHYLIFRFLLNYLLHFNKLTNIYTDYDKQCTLETYEFGQKYFLKPDAIIIPPNEDTENLITLEADTHTEKHLEIFEKILKYFLIARSINDLGVKHIHLYFVFGSMDRFTSIFSLEEGNIYAFFKDANNFKKSKTRATMMIKQIITLLKEEKIIFYSGTFDQPFDDFKKVDFISGLFKKVPRWQTI